MIDRPAPAHVCGADLRDCPRWTRRSTRDEILARAAAYPYEAPLRSFVQRDGEAHELAAELPDLAGRRPLLCYGANAAPAMLARKLAALPHEPLPLLRAAARSASTSSTRPTSRPTARCRRRCRPARARGAGLRRLRDHRAGAAAERDRAQLRAAAAARPGAGASTGSAPSTGSTPTSAATAASALEGGAVALAAVEAEDRRLPALDEAEVLERVRQILAPELDLGELRRHRPRSRPGGGADRGAPRRLDPARALRTTPTQLGRAAYSAVFIGR